MPLRKAVVVDQWELFRLGIEHVLDEADIPVTASTPHVGVGLQHLRAAAADLLIVGRHADLKHQHVLREAKRRKPSPTVVMLLDQVERQDVARLLSLGADGLLLRTATADELRNAIDRLAVGERVVAPALASGVLGRVGPALGLDPAAAKDRSGLSPKELEVLAVLAEGATYQEIADALIVTKATVKTHLVHIYSKLEVKNREQAVARALALGLLG